MITYLLRYLKFITKSSNQHGVHSPFVYGLVTKCLYKKTNKKKWLSFLKIKQQLLDNKNYIKVTDFGAGSKIFKSNKRQVSKIVRVAGISNRKAKILIKLVDYFCPEYCLEIGTSVGLGTSAIKIGNLNAKITTLEGCPETANIAQKTFKNKGFTDISIIVGDFNKTLQKTLEDKKIDFLYFDGNHTKEATLKYFNQCLPTVHNNSIWVFDDIYWTQEMQDAWIEIKAHPKVSVTVDIFHFGIVFFRKEQQKENFKIRV